MVGIAFYQNLYKIKPKELGLKKTACGQQKKTLWPHNIFLYYDSVILLLPFGLYTVRAETNLAQEKQPTIGINCS